MGAVKKKIQKVMGKGSSTDSGPAPAATVATTTPSGYNVTGGDFALFLEELMKRKTLG